MTLEVETNGEVEDVLEEMEINRVEFQKPKAVFRLEPAVVNTTRPITHRPARGLPGPRPLSVQDLFQRSNTLTTRPLERATIQVTRTEGPFLLRAVTWIGVGILKILWKEGIK